MQTFLPSSSFEESAKWLDDRRLNKQILEARTIYGIIISGKAEGAWVNHPITKMWRKYPEALTLYYNECLHQWKDIRHRNHSYKMIIVDKYYVSFPLWLGDNRLHSSHRANLLRKDYDFYRKYGWDEQFMEYWKMPYWWGEEYGYGKVPIEK